MSYNRKNIYSFILILFLSFICGMTIIYPKYLLGISIAGLALIVCAIYPFVGLLISIFLIPIQRSSIGYAGDAVFAGILLITFVSLFINKSLRKDKIFPRMTFNNILYYLPLIYLGYCFLSLLFRLIISGDMSGGLIYLHYSVEAYILLMLISLFVENENDLRKALKSYLLVGVVIAFAGLIDGLSGRNIIMELMKYDSTGIVLPRATSIYFDPNHLAIFMASIIFILSSYWYISNSILILLYIAIALASLIFTYSLTVFVGMAVGVIIYMYFLQNKLHKFILYAGVVLSVCIFAFYNIYIYLPYSFKDKVSSFMFDPMSVNTFSTRIYLDMGALDYFKSSPIHGIGYGNYENLFQISPYILDMPRKMAVSHNSYFLIMAEGGMIGIIIMTFIIYLGLKTAVNNINRIKDKYLRIIQIGILSGLIVNIIFGFTYATLTFNLNFWYLMALTLVIKKMAHE